MTYDFSEIFGDTAPVLEEFITLYTSCMTMDEEALSNYMPLRHYTQIVSLLNTDFEEEELLSLFDTLAKYYIVLDTPYIIITNEIHNLKTVLINHVKKSHTSEIIVHLFSLFKNINNRIAKLYLTEYIYKLKSLNNVRINSLADLIDKNMLVHYEAHLLWLSQLAGSIERQDMTNFPEINSSMCDFGKWLEDDAKFIIQNNSKFKAINTLHDNLHLFAEKIFRLLLSDENHVIITYLEKCEMLSLSIGTELALIDNIMMNHKVTKDPLTGSLNRQGLASIFKSQYELALATNNHFILAMCDLDHFKAINDNYGHLIGDAVLMEFVNIVKHNIRNSDIIMRYGGEEFIIILPAIDKTRGFEVLNKIREDFNQHLFNFDAKEFTSSVSIGFVDVQPQMSYKQHFLNDYLALADQKLYAAKTNGRNRIEHC